MTTTLASLQLRSFSLRLSAVETRRLEGLLSSEERARAASFRFGRHRERFIVGRGRLRELLGEVTGRDPRALSIVYGLNGKPEVAESRVRFNLSHCEDFALLAVTWGRAVGVDVERLRPVADRELVAERFFSRPEVQALSRVPVVHRDVAFLRCWTRKEAYLKALGGGLSLDLAAFAVSLGRDDACLAWAENADELDRWSLVDVSDRCPGHVAAIVLESREA